MEVILLERIDKIGQMGEIVSVKPGFARNYLLPEGKALRSSKENKAYFEAKRVELEERDRQRRAEADKLAGKISGLNIVMVRQAAESGLLYGSVSIRDVRDAVKEEGFVIERRQVLLDQPIKELGHYKVKIGLHPEVSQEITVNVARSAEDAERQAKQAKDSDLVAEVDEELAAEVAELTGTAEPEEAEAKEEATA